IPRLDRATGTEINLALGPAGFDEQPMNCGRLESIRPGVGDRRFHAGKALPVKKSLAWRGVGVGDEVPEWWHEFVGFVSSEGDDFDRSESVLAVEQKGDRIDQRRGSARLNGPGLRNDLNTRTIDPVGEVIRVNAGQHGGQDDQNVLL